MISSVQLRTLWDQFRKERMHARSSPAALINSGKEDATTLFNVAGMQPLVPYLMGKPHPDGTRLYNIQGCIRTPDMEDIGDERHLTYFEMMGNWSLGDYFKDESIAWSVDFLVKLGIPLDKLWATVFAGDTAAGIPLDEVSIAALQKAGITHIKQMWFDENKESDNFRRPGPVGPCGPCCEFYFDRGEGYGAADRDMWVNDRYTEIWNNVFMAYYDDGTGNLVELPTKNVDTGMWFERLCMVLQNTDTIFETDVFASALHVLEGVAILPYPGFMLKTEQFTDLDTYVAKSYRIVVDHLRTSSLLLFEWLTPSNEWRGYVLRRLIRRMRYHLNKLSEDGQLITQRDDFDDLLLKLINEILASQSDYDAFRQLVRDVVFHWLSTELNQFATTVAKGQQLLQEYFTTPGKTSLTGEEVFKMYDTFGLPMELTKEVAVHAGFSVDEEGYYRCLEEAKERSRQQSGKMFAKGTDRSTYLEWIAPTEFVGYTTTELDSAKLLKDFVVEQKRILIFDRTPFYAESGWQKGDTWTIVLDSGESVRVVDVQKYSGVWLHFVSEKMND
jgi:alanyl-tRNA synthetase